MYFIKIKLVQTRGFYKIQKVIKFSEKSTNYRCFPATAKWLSTSHRNISIKFIIFSFFTKRPGFCNSLCPLSPVSKGFYTFFNWMKNLEYFLVWADLTQKERFFWETAYLPLLRMDSHTVFCWDTWCFINSVSSSTQLTCCFKLLIFSTPMFQWNQCTWNNPGKPERWLTLFIQESDTVNGYRRRLESTFSIIRKSKIICTSSYSHSGFFHNKHKGCIGCGLGRWTKIK